MGHWVSAGFKEGSSMPRSKCLALHQGFNIYNVLSLNGCGCLTRSILKLGLFYRPPNQRFFEKQQDSHNGVLRL